MGERSVLVIRPYLYRLNSQSTISSTMDLALPCHFIHIIGDNIRETLGINFSLRLSLSATIEIGHIYMDFYMRGTRPIGRPIVTTQDGLK